MAGILHDLSNSVLGVWVLKVKAAMAFRIIASIFFIIKHTFIAEHFHKTPFLTYRPMLFGFHVQT